MPTDFNSIIRQKIDEALIAEAESGRLQDLGRAAINFATSILNAKKNEFLQAFTEHEVTQEILAGPSANYGVEGVNGNLASFLGFDKGQEKRAVKDLYNFFDKSIILNPKYRYDKNSRSFIFQFRVPDLDDVKNVTDMEEYCSDDNGWGAGRSWAVSIERGIPGLGNYKFSTNPRELYGKNGNAKSRSGTALQRPNQIRSAQYRPQKYISDLLKLLK